MAAPIFIDDQIEVDVGLHVRAVVAIILAEARDRGDAFWLADDFADAVKDQITEVYNGGWKFP